MNYIQQILTIEQPSLDNRENMLTQPKFNKSYEKVLFELTSKEDKELLDNLKQFQV